MHDEQADPYIHEMASTPVPSLSEIITHCLNQCESNLSSIDEATNHEDVSSRFYRAQGYVNGILHCRVVSEEQAAVIEARLLECAQRRINELELE